MVKHIVAFRFKPEISEVDRSRLLRELNELPGRFPNMQRWSFGKNISPRDSTFTYAFVVEFGTKALLLEYLNSAEHESFAAERFQPLIESRAIVDFEA